MLPWHARLTRSSARQKPQQWEANLTLPAGILHQKSCPAQWSRHALQGAEHRLQSLQSRHLHSEELPSPFYGLRQSHFSPDKNGSGLS